MTRTVRDAALMMDVIAGPDDRDRHSLPAAQLSYLNEIEGGIEGLKVAWSKDLGYAPVDPAVREIISRAVQVFSSLGCELEEADPDIENPEHVFRVIVSTDTAASLGDKLDEWGDKMDALLPRFVQMGQSFSGVDLQKANHERKEFWDSIRPFFEKYELLLTPTLAVPPFDVESMGPRHIDGVKVSPTGWLNFTFPFNLTGQPAATVPAGWTDDGLPIGLQIIGRRHDDVTVLRAAAAFEEAAPWAQRRPQVD
jgi:aspartyl-tRNA(Asn)/glutamyl-tRNA(Gln) amidotransferase subunit A